jgi:hypothetical protein
MSIHLGAENDMSAGEELYAVFLDWINGLDVGNKLALSSAIERGIPWSALSPNLRRELDNFGEQILGEDE